MGTGRATAFCLALALTACAPVMQGALMTDGPPPPPAIEETWIRSFDGARLGLHRHAPASDAQGDVAVVAVHGMNDHSGAFRAAGAFWAREGAVVYAYDQRGFGRSPEPGLWPEPDLMRRDLAVVVRLVKEAHPDRRVVVVGESMGAAVAVTAFASDDPPDADALVLSAPGFRGWGALPWLYRVSLWTSARVRPGWIVTPPRGVRITPTDNREKLIEMWNDPLVLKKTRIDAVHGVVGLMEEANDALGGLPGEVPVLVLYGGRDEVIPADGVERAMRRAPAHVRSAFYPEGYHLLLNDRAAERVWRDILAFAQDPQGALPSGSGPLPWTGGRSTAD